MRKRIERFVERHSRSLWAALLLFIFLVPGDRLIWPADAQSGPAVYSGFLQLQNSVEGQKATYRAASVALVPAASATDLFCVAGSATKTIRVTHVAISGTAGTLVSTPFYLAKRASVDTGGTAATSNALPVEGLLDTGVDGASGATLVAYTANPTITDASPKLVAAGTLTLPTAAAGTVIQPLVFDFGKYLGRAAVLRGAAQQLCVNANGATITTGSLQVEVEYTAE